MDGPTNNDSKNQTLETAAVEPDKLKTELEQIRINNTVLAFRCVKYYHSRELAEAKLGLAMRFITNLSRQTDTPTANYWQKINQDALNLCKEILEE